MVYQNGRVDRIEPQGETKLGEVSEPITLMTNADGSVVAVASRQEVAVFANDQRLDIEFQREYREVNLVVADDILYAVGQFDHDTVTFWPHAYTTTTTAYSISDGTKQWQKTLRGPVTILSTTPDGLWLAHQKDWEERDVEIHSQNHGWDHLGRNFDWGHDIYHINKQGDIITSFEALGCIPLFGKQIDDEFVIGFAATGEGRGKICYYNVASGELTRTVEYEHYLINGGILANNSMVLLVWNDTPGRMDVSRLTKHGEEIERKTYSVYSILSLRPSGYDALWINPNGANYAIRFAAGHLTTLQNVQVFDQDGRHRISYQVPLDSASTFKQKNLASDGGLWISDRYYRPK